MAEIIYKYQLIPASQRLGFFVDIPTNFTITDIGAQGLSFIAWAIGPDTNPKTVKHHRFHYMIIPTGEAFELPPEGAEYVKRIEVAQTFQYHLFKINRIDTL